MMRDGVFLQDSDWQLSDKIAFSAVKKKCYFDHHNGVLMCHDCKVSLPHSTDFYHPLCDAYDDAVHRYEKYFGRVNRFNKDQNNQLITNIRDILLESQRKKNRDADQIVNEMDLASYVDDYVRSREKSRVDALLSRIKRFGRKAFYYEDKYQWFITITRSDDLFPDEESFFKSLSHCLANLVDRYGFRFQGVWERGEVNDRLHFHAFLYIPENSTFKHTLSPVKRWSDKKQKWQSFLESDFFKSRFGNNEWEELKNRDGFVESIRYMTKYCTKTPVRFYYSRYMPDTITKILSYDQVYFTVEDGVQKWFVSSRDVLDLSWAPLLYRRHIDDYIQTPLPFAN